MASLGGGRYHGMFLRWEISQRCRQKEEPYCADKSDITPETCAWACLHFGSYVEGTTSNAWPCPGEAKCIARNQICDGIRDCGNGQDENENLCTEEFCRNGFVSYDNNKLNWTSDSDDTIFFWYLTDPTEMAYDYIFLSYRYPNLPPNHKDECKGLAKGGGKAALHNLEIMDF